MNKRQKVYMVSFPENADYAEWWSMAGLFSTREKAEKFIKEHKIMEERRRYRRKGLKKYRTRYYPIAEIALDMAPIVHNADEEYEKSFYGLHNYDLGEYFYKAGRKVRLY